MNAHETRTVDAQTGGSNAGWIAGLLIILAVLAVGGALWFMYHP